jgi:hypothetical protein
LADPLSLPTQPKSTYDAHDLKQKNLEMENEMSSFEKSYSNLLEENNVVQDYIPFILNLSAGALGKMGHV